MDIDDPIQVESRRPHSSLPPFAIDVNHFPSLGTGIASRVSHTREITDEVKDGIGTSAQSGRAPNIENVTETAHGHGSGINEPVILDDDDDDDEGNTPYVRIPEVEGHGIQDSSDQHAPSAPTVINVPDDGYDIEEEMIRAAIEASRQDVAMTNQQYDPLVCDNFVM